MIEPPIPPDELVESFKKSSEKHKARMELSASASRTAWKIAIFSLFGGFLLGVFAQDFKTIVFQACKTLASAVQPSEEAPRTLPPVHQPKEKVQTPKSE